jgi:hypothetical protein
VRRVKVAEGNGFLNLFRISRLRYSGRGILGLISGSDERRRPRRGAVEELLLVLLHLLVLMNQSDPAADQ